ncbi:MAG TPA: response regulator transcription factor [Ktedonosporobacter sp.]|jgi:ATP/maltotriose-dependent transcriptional regulator MalT|nr:response regulator transcription factor [Ktedonosporobacter sp.]
MADPLTCGARYLRQPTLVFHALERMEMLEPELMRGVCCDLPSYALVYVEQYRGDVPRLEREREFLCAALVQARQQDRHTDVLRLAEGLSYLVGRLDNAADADRILLWGIEAACQLRDRRRQACLLNRRGNLLFSHGQRREGRRIWWESLDMARGQVVSEYLWEIFYSFVHIADILGDYCTAQYFSEMVLQADQVDDLDSAAVVIFIRGFHARLAYNLQQAYTDYQTCLRYLSRPEPGVALSPERQLFMMVVQAELARVQGDFPRSHEYSESALALARLFSDIYAIVDLLMDQGAFAYQQKKFSEMEAILAELQTIAQQTNAPLFHTRTNMLQRLLEDAVPNQRPANALQIHRRSSPPPTISLSDRELEVLHLVAAGLSNNEIAARLVVTTSTVKKHLEHIYDRLNVSSRTHAVARGRELNLLP